MVYSLGFGLKKGEKKNDHEARKGEPIIFYALMDKKKSARFSFTQSRKERGTVSRTRKGGKKKSTLQRRTCTKKGEPLRKRRDGDPVAIYSGGSATRKTRS